MSRLVVHETEHPWVVAAAALAVCLAIGAVGGVAGGEALVRLVHAVLGQPSP
jgi:hypothetical protein